VQKRIKKIGQGMETHNLVGRGSWTHAKYDRKCRAKNPKHMKFRRGA
jgi:hypothetical protein